MERPQDGLFAVTPVAGRRGILLARLLPLGYEWS